MADRLNSTNCAGTTIYVRGRFSQMKAFRVGLTYFTVEAHQCTVEILNLSYARANKYLQAVLVHTPLKTQ
jgi:hypothetical protein